MIPPSGDKSDVLFKRVLIASLLTYFILALVIEMIPYTREVKRGVLKPQRIVKLIEIPLKEPQLSDEQKKRQEEERRLAEERRLKEERRRQELKRQKTEEQKHREEEKRLVEERKRTEDQKKKEEEEKRLTEERQQKEEHKKQELEKQKAEEQKRQEEERRLAEERRLREEKKRQETEQREAEEKKRMEEEQQRIEKQRRQEEEQRLAEEQKRIAEQKRLEEEKRIAEERRRIEEEKRLAKEKNREVAMSSGLLKTTKGGKKSLDTVVSNEEISSAVTTPSDKLIQTPLGKTQTAPPSPKGVERPLKGSEGIGDVSGTLAKTDTGGFSGKRGVAGIEVKHIDMNETRSSTSGKNENTGGGDTDIYKPRSKESIKEEIVKNKGGLDFIYKKALRNNLTLKGVVVIEFTIAANGDVTGARIVSSTVKDPSFEDQVLKRIQSWRFPPLPESGNTVVTYPIEFSPV